jgi:hypothetical protein
MLLQIEAVLVERLQQFRGALKKELTHLRRPLVREKVQLATSIL